MDALCNSYKKENYNANIYILYPENFAGFS